MNTFGVVLLNMGGPTSLDAVRPFLENLFLDEEIISFGPVNFARKPLARFIAKKRAEIVKKNYAMIGGKSPIRELSEKQGDALRAKLEERFGAGSVHVEVGFSYWHPFIEEAFENLRTKGVERVFLMTLYPHYSKTTTGSCFKTWRNLHRKYNNRAFKVQSVKMYPKNSAFVAAINKRIDEALARFPEGERANVHLQFSAHGTPVSLVKQGDPYSFQIKDTVEAVMDARGRDLQYHLSFQSKVGPAKWLEPNTEEFTAELAKEGVKYLLVVPVAFVSDHIETLHELGIDLRETAKEAGIVQFEVTEGLNDMDEYITALAEEITPKMQRVLSQQASQL